MKYELDPMDARILAVLQEDARLSMRELGRRVGLSAPAVTERVRRLEEARVLLGYHALVSPAALGRGIQAFIGVQESGQRDPQLVQWAKTRDGVLEVHSVTGENSCMIKVALRDISELKAVLSELIELGFTCSTSMVLETLLSGKVLELEGVREGEQGRLRRVVGS
ncbi:MAG: Lrp/AsnC family transcriptional regulator [Pseudopedobacter sp.]|nr:Lrp/AsnC family transcriptional regulator [Deinococcales bacterium]